MTLPIEETITDLGDSDQPLLNSKLIELSNLSSADLEFLKHAWATTESKRRFQAISRLVELAENNIELNFDSVFKFYLQDEDDKIRSKAIEGLWENEEFSLIDPLIQLLEQDDSETVQATAATALGKFSILAECQKPHSDHVSKIQTALLAVISNQNKPVEVRRRALEAAAPANLPQLKPAIMEAYRSHDPRLKISSIYAMGKNYDPSWLPILLKELANSDAEMRYEVAGACGELEEEEAVPYLIEVVNDPDIDVRMAAIRALGKIGNTQARECLEQCRSNPSEAINQAAEQALFEVKAKEDPLFF